MNEKFDLRKYKKAIAAALLPLITAAVMGFTEENWDFDETEVVGLITTLVTAPTVYALRNLENRVNRPQEKGRFAGE